MQSQPAPQPLSSLGAPGILPVMKHSMRTMIACMLMACGKASDPSQAITIQFAPVVGTKPFSCTDTFTVGTQATRVSPLDFKVYIHSITLITANDERVAVALDQDGQFQRDNVAMLDFEDGTGNCNTGSPSTHLAVTATAPVRSDYKGVEFTLGVPEAQNHLDGATAPAPFNVPGMWWSWAGGFKFARLDLKVENGSEYYFHMGATTCDGDTNVGFRCKYNNQATITLPAFDARTQSITVDVAALYADSNLSLQPDFQTDFVAGCMAFSGDPECPAVFGKVGLKFEEHPMTGNGSQFFSVRQ